MPFNNLKKSNVFSTPELDAKSSAAIDTNGKVINTNEDIDIVDSFDNENQVITKQKSLFKVSDIIPGILSFKKELEQTKLLKHIQNQTNINTANLNFDFAPYFAYFANSFSDLNKYILPYNATELENDELGLKKKLNQHMEEDECHNGLFNDDMQLVQSKFNSFTFSDYLNFLWNDNIKNSRIIGFEIAKLTQVASDPRLRYCLIRTIEELGNTFFSISYKCTINGQESKYFGSIHLGYEPGGLHLEDNNEEEFLNQNLTLEEYNLAKGITQECYTLFFNFLEELYEVNNYIQV